jgi:hypothetical protein
MNSHATAYAMVLSRAGGLRRESFRNPCATHRVGTRRTTSHPCVALGFMPDDTR